MMISPIGNKRRLSCIPRTAAVAGFSFVEVMTAVVVLSTGIVLIYQAFFASLNYLTHLNYRLYAANLLINKIADIEGQWKIYKALPLGDKNSMVSATFGQHTVDFIFEVSLSPLKNLDNIYQADVALLWNEGRRNIRMSRSFYMTDD